MRRNLSSSLVALSIIFGLGCSAIINPDDNRLGGGGLTDAGTNDTGIVINFDAGPQPDVGMVDCSDGFVPFCSEETRVICVDGRAIGDPCNARGAYCEAGVCEAWACTPSTQECTADRTSFIVCNARGDGGDQTRCPSGQMCDPLNGRCGGIPDMCTDLQDLEPGDSHDINLCELADAETPIPVSSCPTTDRADSGDQIFELRIETAGRYIIELEDVDSGARVDTVLYLRTDCARAESQIACGDDSPCDSPVDPRCLGGLNVQRSEIVIDLTPGTYYIVADAYVYDRGGLMMYDCGRVRLSVNSDPGG